MPTSSPKYSIIAVALILGCLLAGYFIFNNFWPAYTQANDSYAAAGAENQRLKQALDSIQSFLLSFKEHENSATQAKLVLPAGNADIPNFIASISQIAQASGVALSNFQITNAPDSAEGSVNSIQTEDLSLGASGTYASFKDFLLRIETHLRLIDIYHVSVGAQALEAGTPILQFQMKMHTYFQK